MKKKCEYLLQSDCFFLMLLLGIGIITTFSYGVYWDQGNEQNILYSNIKEYALHFDFIDARWIEEIRESEVTPISESAEKDHGIALYYPAFVVRAINDSSPYAGSLFWHLYTFLLVFLGIAALYLLCKDLFGDKKIAVVTTLLFYLTPRMFAAGHYNNKDMVLVSLVFMLFYWGRRLCTDITWKSVIMFATVGAYAFNLKIIGAWFFGMLGIYAFLNILFTKRFQTKVLVKGMVCILWWFGCFLLITPATWSGIGDYFKYVLGFSLNFDRWSEYIFYNGQMIHSVLDGLPNKYLPTMILYTVPVVILGLTAMGSLWVIFALIKGGIKKIWDVEGYITLLIFLGVIPLIYAVLVPPIIYNGWRHFYFVYASMIIGAGYGVFRLNGLLGQWGACKLKQVVTISYLGISALFLAINYPVADSYYNVLAGPQVELRYEMDYWNLSMKQAYKAVWKDVAKKTVTVSGMCSHTFEGLKDTHAALPQKMKQRIQLCSVEDWKESEYVVVNVTYDRMYATEEYEWLQENYEKVKTIRCYGNKVAEVYKQK